MPDQSKGGGQIMRTSKLVLAVILMLVILYASIRISYADSDADSESRRSARPNIIYIMLDDLDYYDVGAYGSPDIQTPNLDALAAEGMRFTQYYTNSPVCSPSRASILTGGYPARFGIDRILTSDSYRGIPGDVTTIAQVLSKAGYRTAHIGKWHVGTKKREFLPIHKGFDYVARYVRQLRTRAYTEYRLIYNEGRLERYTDKGHLTEVLTDEAMNFIAQSHWSDPDKPFFLNLWYHAPHEPLQVPTTFDNSKTHYCIDYDLDHTRCASPRGNFSALVTDADLQIGRILSLLNALGIAKNTLVVVSSDNGGNQRTHTKNQLPQRSLRGYKTDVFDGGLRVPFIARWPNIIPAGSVNNSVVASFDLYPTLAQIIGADIEKSGLNGKSFLSVLRKNTFKPRAAPLFWETKLFDHYFTNPSGVPETYAVRDGDWKLVYIPAHGAHLGDDTMLFNMKRDPSEKRDLLAEGQRRPYKPEKHTNNNIRGGAEARRTSGTPPYQAIANKLQAKYYRWRREVGEIAYQPVLSASGVSGREDVLTFNGGVATVTRDARFDFNDGSFSFLTRIKPFETHDTSVIAEKDKSWQLLIENGALKLIAFGPPDAGGATLADKVVLSTPIKANQESQVAFTATGWGLGGGESEFRLFLNGELKDKSVRGKSIRNVYSKDQPRQPIILIGNDKSGDMPFHGEIRRPQMSVLALYPSEVHFQEVSENRKDKTRQPGEEQFAAARHMRPSLLPNPDELAENGKVPDIVSDYNVVSD